MNAAFWKRVALALLATAIATTAGAHVGPPVHVFLDGAPRAAQKGVAFEGTLRFDTRADITLSNVVVGGARWGSGRTAPASTSVRKGAPARVPFSIVPEDPTAPLEVSFEVNGEPYQLTLDLSPAALEQASHVGALVPVTPGAKVAPSAPHAFAQAEPVAATDGLFDPAGPVVVPRTRPTAVPMGAASAQARVIRVHGRFLYPRMDGLEVGVDGATIRVYDDNGATSLELASTLTDGSGNFDVSFTWNGCLFCGSQPDLYVVCATENGRVTVKNPVFLTAPYTWRSWTTPAFSGTDLDLGTFLPADGTNVQALHILTTLMRGWRFHFDHGYDLPWIVASWPFAFTFYDGLAINFDHVEEWFEGTIVHEQGHHWEVNFGVFPAPLYCNGVCDGLNGPCGHCGWCAESGPIAWLEGFPDWLYKYIPDTFPSVYGTARLNPLAPDPDDRAQIDTTHTDPRCPGPQDPWATEGDLAALINDIVDSTQDTLAVTNSAGNPVVVSDQITLPVETVYNIAHFDMSGSTAEFVADFRARFPGLAEPFWQVGMLSGLDTDSQPPGIVTGLASTSHTVGATSYDPTVDVTWTAAPDDASGIHGYAVTWTNAATMPPATLTIGARTQLTSPILSAGNWYFNIRAVDRDGRWATSYQSIGPFVIATPSAFDASPLLLAGWANVLVPRPAADATTTSVPAPATLAGNACTTWWNASGHNTGSTALGAVGFSVALDVDGDLASTKGFKGVASFGSYNTVNTGPVCVTGGRHTLTVRHDATDVAAEPNETDNAWSHQWVWSPLDITAPGPYARSAPPLATAGWSSIVDGSPAFYNCDGFGFTNTGWWDAVTVRSESPGDDYDLRLFPGTTTPTSGYSSYVITSSNPSGLDAVFINKNMLGTQSYHAGTINAAGGTANSVVEHVLSEDITVGPTVARTLAVGQSMALFEFASGGTPLTADVQVTEPSPGRPQLRVRWLSPTTTITSLSEYGADVASDANGLARIVPSVVAAGYHCLAVYRDTAASTRSVAYTVHVYATPPDFMPTKPEAWAGPLVPRPAPDGTSNTVPAPTSLTGDVASTYFNFATVDYSPTGSSGLYQEARLDGGSSYWYINWGAFAPFGVNRFNWYTPWTVPGGRHTLSTVADPLNAQPELSETNNAWGRQWVWTPSTLGLGALTVRATPGQAWGGWDQGVTGPLYWNEDGLRMPAFDAIASYWGALAVMPVSNGVDVDLRLHELATDAQTGFDVGLATSAFGPGQSDYVMACYRATPFRPFDVGILNLGTISGAYAAEMITAPYEGLAPYGTIGPYTLGAGHIAQLHEFQLTPGTWTVTVLPTSGLVDWGLSVHDGQVAYHGKLSSIPGGISWLAPAGEPETAEFTVGSTGYYCVAVYKSTTADLAAAGSYMLRFTQGALDAPTPGTPASVAFRGAFPNPMHQGTRFEFDLPAERDVSLEIFDLGGARVRTLAEGRTSSGTHAATWAGDDDHGRSVVPGIYYARFASAGTVLVRKLVKLE